MSAVAGGTAESAVQDAPADGREALRIAIVGGGVSGVIAAAVLSSAGHDVTLFEKAADLGGVWSASRAYPGISTQDDHRSYTFSDAAMPAGVAEHPAGADVRAYLERYLADRGLHPRVRLGTEVVRADLVGDREWVVESSGPAGTRTEHFDWLVAANGVFSLPHVPVWPGRDAFEAAGGRVVTPGSLADGAALDGVRTVVVGWGKTAGDVAAVASTRSSHVDVIARTLNWKYPKRIGLAGITFRHIVLTRAGERIVGTSYRDRNGRILLRRIPERIPRLLIDGALGRAADRTAGFSGMGLKSTKEFRASTSLVSEGFFEAVAEGRITVHREQTVRALGAGVDGPWVELGDGTRLRADVLVAATGYEQGMDFLSPAVLARATQPDGTVLLHRRILAVDVPRLALIGWVHNYRSPITAEVSAAWLAALLQGRVVLPALARRRRDAAHFRLTAGGAAVNNTASVPSVSMHDLDVLMAEMGAPLPWRTRLRQIWQPLDPADYAAAVRSVRRARAVTPR